MAEPSGFGTNVARSIAGIALPVAAALVSIPFLIAGLGDERFGLLSIVWLVQGYLALVDLGIGRALIQLTAERLGKGEVEEVPSLLWTSLACMGVLGALAGIGLAAIAPWALPHALHEVDPALQDEVVRVAWCVCAMIPLVTVTSGMGGFLMALQRFDLLNRVRIPTGILLVCAPLAVLPWSRSLVAVMVALSAVRIASFVLHLHLCRRALPGLDRGPRWRSRLIPPLMRFGGWMTVSNVLAPLILGLDRLLVGALVSLSQVAFYTTPFEMVHKLLMIPGAIASVLFPAFAAAKDAPHELAALHRRWTATTALALFPLALAVVALAPQALGWWLGDAFGERGGRVAQVLALGIFANGLAQIPFALVQGVGRPDLTARLHLIEFPFYAAGAAWLVLRHGIVGAAWAWTIRAIVEHVALLAMSDALCRGSSRWLWLGPPAAFVPAALFVVAAPGDRAWWLCAGLAAFAAVAANTIGRREARWAWALVLSRLGAAGRRPPTR